MTETTLGRERRIVQTAALTMGSLLIASGCGTAGETAIEGGKSATLLDKSTDSHWVSGTGYDHWEKDFEFILKQCERSGGPVDDEGCVTLLVDVDSATYDKYETGDEIVFENDIHGKFVS